MARTNKYTSINFNHIYDKNPNTNAAGNPTRQPTSSSSSFSPSSPNPNALYKSHLQPHHGRMLVLTRPTSKPVTIPPPQQPPSQPDQTRPDRSPPEPSSDSISLRPLGRTGTGSSFSAPVLGHVTSPKPEKFVPPHLRPGFVGKEERPGPEVVRARGEMSQRQQGYFGSPGRYGEDGRPESGGYERMRRGGGESDLGVVSRPSSSGSRPGSSGWTRMEVQ